MLQQIFIRKNGPASVLSFEEKNLEKKPQTELKSDEALIEVHYTGINFADIVMRLGFYKDAPPKPFVPGYEYSGVVVAIGSGVKHLKIGDKVYGGTVFGGYTNQIKVPAHMTIPLPEGYSLEEGAALPVAFITANAAINEMGRVRKGDKVLIDCATGGLGTMALKMLKYLGAETIGLTSASNKKELIESLGAKAMTHDEFWNSNEDRFDFILNSQGGSTISKHYDRLGPTGRIVCIGLSEGIKGGKRDFIAIAKAAIAMPRFSIISMFDRNKGVYALNALKLMEDETYLRKNIENFKLISEWNLRPILGKTFRAKEAALAHQYIEQRKGTGKILLEWSHV